MACQRNMANGSSALKFEKIAGVWIVVTTLVAQQIECCRVLNVANPLIINFGAENRTTFGHLPSPIKDHSEKYRACQWQSCFGSVLSTP
jgi:hypothetical protein